MDKEINVEKKKKDRIFIIVLGLVLANLTVYFIDLLLAMPAGFASITWWALTIANCTAIVGVLWLLRNHKRSKKIEREKSTKETEHLG